MSKLIDCKGLKCPQPVINTKKYFDSVESGEAEVIVDNETAKINILKFAESNGFKAEAKEQAGIFTIRINKDKCSCKIINDDKKLVITVTSDKFGTGDDKLGSVLMKSYFYALSEADRIPTDLIFVNSGVKLTTEGSDVIDSIKKLEERGVNVLSCGTCLDFYNLKEKLQAGQVTNMYTIVEKMNNADNTIKL